MRDLRASIGAQNQSPGLERAPHQGHSRRLDDVSGRLILRSSQIEPYDPVGPNDTKRVHALGSNVDASFAPSRCYEEHLLSVDKLTKGVIYALELGHRTSPELARPSAFPPSELVAAGGSRGIADHAAFLAEISCVALQNVRGAPPSGHISARTAALASSWTLGSKAAVVTPASASQAASKLANSKIVVTFSQFASSPAARSWETNSDGSASAPGPTRSTGPVGAKLPAVCWNITMSASAGPAQTAATNRPPGRSTLASSFAAVARSMTYMRLSEAMITSTLASLTGIASARPSARSTFVMRRPRSRSLALLSISGLMSTALMRPLVPTWFAAQIATAPVPVPRSRTVSPGRRSASLKTCSITGPKRVSISISYTSAIRSHTRSCQANPSARLSGMAYSRYL